MSLRRPTTAPGVEVPLNRRQQIRRIVAVAPLRPLNNQPKFQQTRPRGRVSFRNMAMTLQTPRMKRTFGKMDDFVTKLTTVASNLFTDPWSLLLLACALLSATTIGVSGVDSLLTAFAKYLKGIPALVALGDYILQHETRVIGIIIAAGIAVSFSGDKRLLMFMGMTFLVMFGPEQKAYQYFLQAFFIKLLFRFRNDKKETMYIFFLIISAAFLGVLFSPPLPSGTPVSAVTPTVPNNTKPTP